MQRPCTRMEVNHKRGGGEGGHKMHNHLVDLEASGSIQMSTKPWTILRNTMKYQHILTNASNTIRNIMKYYANIDNTSENIKKGHDRLYKYPQDH